MTNKIDYISADNGGINFYSGRDDVAMQLNKVGFAKTPKMVAYILKTKGTRDSGVNYSSSMDFANEYGFKKDSGAWDLFESGLELLGE